MNTICDDAFNLELMAIHRIDLGLPLYKLDSIESLRTEEKQFLFFRTLNRGKLKYLEDELIFLLNKLMSWLQTIYDILRRFNSICSQSTELESNLDKMMVANLEMINMGQEIKKSAIVIYSDFYLLKKKLEVYSDKYFEMSEDVYSFISCIFPSILKE
ncbi:hypothetical protein TNCV_3347701 [Trichonephila clavipes]|nr:hypothetical protein TNCV_3347701 [Trichonephila clavipes]